MPEENPVLDTIGTPTLLTVTLVAVVALLALDFALTRKPHEVSMKEAVRFQWRCTRAIASSNPFLSLGTKTATTSAAVFLASNC